MSDDDIGIGSSTDLFSSERISKKTGLFLQFIFHRKKKDYEKWREDDWTQLKDECCGNGIWWGIPGEPVFLWHLSRKQLFDGKDQVLEAARSAVKEALESKARMAEETRLRYLQDNQHIIFLENLESKKAEEAALRFLEIHIKCDLKVKKAQEEARKSALKVFRDFGGDSLDKKLIAGTPALQYFYKAFRKPHRTLINLVKKDKNRWPEDIENVIRPFLFIFEDISILDDRAIQKVLRELDTNKLAVALKGVDSEVRDKVFRNMSCSAAKLMSEDMDYLGPTRIRDVRKAQDEIVEIILKLEAQGDILIPMSDEDQLV